MKLVIVESPTKAKTISKFLSGDYNVMSSFGHVRDLPKSELGIDTENDFEPKYVIPLKARKVVKELKDAAKKSDSIILGTDQDREGEAIAWHLVQALGLNATPISNSQFLISKQIPKSKSKIPKIERIVFHEITKQAIVEALKNPRKIDEKLVDAQQARRILDRLVGYKLSPFLWKKVARGLSAGRVQSVAVRLIADREKEIEQFKTEEYWEIEAELAKENPNTKNSFLAKLHKINSEPILKLGIKSKEEAEKILKGLENAEYKVSAIEKKEVKRNPMPPFTTSTLQQTAWQKFHFPAKMTMSLAQNLYESGYITYHRTDSLNLSEQSLLSAQKYIGDVYGKNYRAGSPKKYQTKTKGAQEAHEAIRPTYPENSPDKLTQKLNRNQWRLYDLIWRRFIACQMAQAVFDATTIDINANDYTFRATGSIMRFDGFLKVYPLKFAASRPMGREENELPPLEQDEILELIKLTPSQHFTQPPPRYTEATLIKTLEGHGIGRPSTYAPIISTIQERNYVEKDENKKFRPTEMGNIVNNILEEHFPEIIDIQFTAAMEENLDKIAEGEKKLPPVLHEFYDPFEKRLQKKYREVSKTNLTEKTDKKCPECAGDIVIRMGKYGKFYACSNFPKCRYTQPLKEKTLNIKCPKCIEGNIVEKRTGRGKIFYGCDQYPKCDFALWDKPLPGRQAGTGEKCPKCGSLLVETKRKQIQCSNKECLPR